MVDSFSIPNCKRSITKGYGSGLPNKGKLAPNIAYPDMRTSSESI